MASKSELLHQYHHENRPWGNFQRFTANQPSTVKLITVNENEAFSLQYHSKRDEFWHILSGSGIVTVGADEFPAKKGDEFFIPAKTNHRARGGVGGLLFLEIGFGEYDEEDIVRLEDNYGRT